MWGGGRASHGWLWRSSPVTRLVLTSVRSSTQVFPRALLGALFLDDPAGCFKQASCPRQQMEHLKRTGNTSRRDAGHLESD